MGKKGKKSTPDRNNKKSRYTKSPVKAKKYLGQHFLKDEDIAEQIADTITLIGYTNVIEIGPGTGVLTKYLLRRPMHLVAMDLDSESIAFLNQSFPLANPEVLQGEGSFKVIEADFLNFDLRSLFGQDQFAITGNFPYNISTQIVFKLLEVRSQVPEFTGMFQKEVALRICAGSGNKTYGILSVLVQAFYVAEYLFTVPPHVFEPPPKVESGVLRLSRKKNLNLTCDEKLFFRVVKSAFNHRRKTLRNSLKTFELSETLREQELFDLRPEQLSVTDFISLTEQIDSDLSQR